MRRDASPSHTSPHLLRRWSPTRRFAYDANLPTALVDAIWRDVDRLVFSATPLQVKDRCIVARYDHAEGALLVKRHTWGGIWRTVRMAWREPSARRCARLGWYLAERGIPTPRPRAYVEHRLGPIGYLSYLFTDFVEGMSLYRYIRFGGPNAEVVEHLARQIASIWQRLVELGLNHDDFKPENFIVDRSLGVWLIDLERIRHDRSNKRREQRQIADVKNFLHMRGWHHRPEARDIFRRAFLDTASGRRLRGAGIYAKPEAGDRRRTDQEPADPELSVLVFCDRHNPGAASARRAIDSVRDIADEIVLATPSPASGRPEVLGRIEPCGGPRDGSATANTRGAWPQTSGVARCEWVLVLQQGEWVTPFLAKELQERIADPAPHDAFRIPMEQQFFGRSVVSRDTDEQFSIRLFRRVGCTYSVANGVPTISADPERTRQLHGTIQKCVVATVGEFVDDLNRQTTRAATQRLRAGQRAHLVRAAWRSIGRFVQQCPGRRGIRSGWAGLHLAFLEAAFLWVEEAKLWQMAGQFVSTDQSAADTLQIASVADDQHKCQPPADAAPRKAA